jgi:hypothetical protein
MPLHKQVTTCRRNTDPSTPGCGVCEHCCLAVCSVCGGAEGTLTTDCPGVKVGAERQEEIYETNLDYTDERGWHLAETARTAARFEKVQKTPDPSKADPRATAAPGIDWSRVDRMLDLQHELTKKAIAWVLADRACDDSAAAENLARVAIASLHGRTDLSTHEQAQFATHERAKIEFQLACRRVERSDEEFKQLARRIVDSLVG